MNQFEKNLERFEKLHPREAIFLSSMPSGKMAKKGDLSNWLDALILEGKELLYIYGTDAGEMIEALLPWLKKGKKHHIVFLEDNLFSLRNFLEVPGVFSEQIETHYFDALDASERIFNHLFWKFPNSSIVVARAPNLPEEKQERFEELSGKLYYDHAMKSTNLQEYLSGGMTFFENFYTNLFALPGSFDGTVLFEAFKNVPAIICGAGPSLEKHLEALKNLADRALIFSGSSSLTALGNASIRPHFGGGIDPNPGQWFRLEAIKDLTYPFFYRNRFYPRALSLIKGKRLYIPGAGGYDAAGWFEKELGLPSLEMEEGQNVINFLLEIAMRMGCNPIIFVGMDLSYTGDKLYAPGILEENHVDFHKETTPDSRPLKVPDIFGNEVMTLYKWVAEAKWISDVAKEHPDLFLINATEGGIGFEGVENIPFKEVQKRYLQQSHPFDLDASIDRGKLAVMRDQVMEACLKLKESLKATISHLEILSEENEKVLEKVEVEGALKFVQTGRAALAELELLEEPAFEAVLSIFNEVLQHLFSRELEEVSHERDVQKQQKTRLLLNKEKFEVLLKIARANLKVLEEVLKHQAKPHTPRAYS